jgi:hypothetical protein
MLSEPLSEEGNSTMKVRGIMGRIIIKEWSINVNALYFS